MTNLDLKFLLNELKNLNNGRIDKIYQNGKAIRIQVYIPTGGSFELFYEPNKMFITDYKRSASKNPGSFAMHLRKHLSGQRIIDFRQHEFDRIIKMETEKNILIFELFSKGNVIFCDKKYNILLPLETQTWKDRDVRPRKKYLYPPSIRDPFSLSKDEFRNLISSSDKELVKFLAIDMSFSGLYAEEICMRAGIEKNKICKEIKDYESIFKTIHSLLEEFGPQLVLKDEIPVDVVPFDMKIYEDLPSRRVTTFSHALDEFFSEKEAVSEEMKIEKKYDKKMQKLERIASEQKEAIEKWKRIEKESKKRGELIYEHFDLVQKIIYGIEKAKQQDLSWEEIKNSMKEEVPEIKEVREGDGRIVLNL